MMRAAAYVRVSTHEQREGISLDAQRAACEKYIAARGWTLGDLYEDVQTARDANRPAFIRLRQRLAEYDAVVCWKLDRIARRTLTALDFLEACAAADVAFISVTEAFDTSTPMGCAALTIAAAFAQLESDHISERVRAAIDRQLERRRLPWRASYGYHRNSGMAQINEAEALVVRRIFRAQAQGRTHSDIAQTLRAEQLDKRGRPWTRQAVTLVLGNPAYIGSPYVGRQRRKGRHHVWMRKADWRMAEGLLPPIISDELWQEVRRRSLRGRRPSRPALLRRLLVCAECGAPWYVRTLPGSGNTAYICAARRDGRCKTSETQERVLVTLIAEKLRQLSQTDGSAAVELADQYHEHERLEAAEQKSGRAWLAFVEGGVGIEVVRRAQAELWETETAVQIGARPPLEGKALAEAVGACHLALGLNDIDEANRRLRQVVARIVVRQDPLGVELVFWAP